MESETQDLQQITETPVAQPAVQAPKTEYRSQPQQVAPSVTQTRQATRLSDSDDEIPETADLLEMSKSGLTARLERHSRRELKARFGTDDPEEIKAKLDRLAEFESKEEDRRREELSTQARLEEDLVRERELRLNAEERVSAQSARFAGKKVATIASRHIDPDMAEAALVALKKHVAKNWTDADFADEKQAYKKVDAFFLALATQRPKFSKNYTGPAPTPAPVKVGISNTSSPAKPAAPLNAMGSATSGGGGKNIKEMTRGELAEWKAKNKISW